MGRPAVLLALTQSASVRTRAVTSALVSRPPSSPSRPGGRRKGGRWCIKRSKAHGACELRTRGPQSGCGREGQLMIRVSGSGAKMLRGVLPLPRRRSCKIEAAPSARNLGFIACQQFCIECWWVVGRRLVMKPRGSRLTRVLAPRSQSPPHRVFH